jgi:hypothetical protein
VKHIDAAAPFAFNDFELDRLAPLFSRKLLRPAGQVGRSLAIKGGH